MNRAYVSYLSALFLFSSNGIVANAITLDSCGIVLSRSVLGTMLLLSLFLLSGHRFTLPDHRRDMFAIAVSGTAMAADWLFLFEAFDQIGVSMSILINYCGPALVMVLSPVLFREHLSGRKMLAFLLTMAGSFLISGMALQGGCSLQGLLCAGFSALSYAAMVISNKLARHTGGFENATVQMFFTFVTVAVFAGCRQNSWFEVVQDNWLPVLWLGLLNTGGGCYLYFSSIGKLPVQTVAICGYLEPLSAVVLSAAILHESITMLQICGAIMILGGAVSGEFPVKHEPAGITSGRQRHPAALRNTDTAAAQQADSEQKQQS